MTVDTCLFCQLVQGDDHLRKADGFVAIPNGPGLGIELDEKALKEFAVR